MQIIDAHHHLWDIENHEYPHMKGPESIRIWGPNTKLRRNYLVEDFLADIRNQNVVKSVHVQANYDHGNPAGETRWLQSVADDPNSQGFPHAIVGWVDFTSSDCERQLEEHAEFSNFRGIRQIASRHPAEPLLDLTPVDLLNDENLAGQFRSPQETRSVLRPSDLCSPGGRHGSPRQPLFGYPRHPGASGFPARAALCRHRGLAGEYAPIGEMSEHLT